MANAGKCRHLKRAISQFKLYDPGTDNRDPPVFGHPGIARLHRLLQIDRKSNGIHDTAEFHESAVAHELDNAPVVLRGLGLEKLSSNCLERRERPSLAISFFVRNRSRAFSIRRRNPAAGLSSRQPQPMASVNILRNTSSR
jgi:hypothetical protein